MANRNKTEFRHVHTITGKVTRVTELNGEFYIGNSNVRAEGKMVHYNGVKYINVGKHRYVEHGDEWSDFACTSDDI